MSVPSASTSPLYMRRRSWLNSKSGNLMLTGKWPPCLQYKAHCNSAWREEKGIENCSNICYNGNNNITPDRLPSLPARPAVTFPTTEYHRLRADHGVLTRASIKLFELGVRTPGRLFLGVWYARGIDFRRFSYAKPSDFRRNFRPTRSDEDV